MSQLPDTPKLFVVMPFDESFTAIYESLIKESFSEAGFHVYRADDITSQQNILRDVVIAVMTADVVVADLTDSNPNVYYELGLAHAFQKNVVLLTQDLESVPFDLRSYRVIEYGTRFDQFDEAKLRISHLAKQIVKGEVVFGNPVTDFGGANLPAMTTSSLQGISPAIASQEESDSPGFLDYIVDIEDGFGELTHIMENVGAQVAAIGDEARAATPGIHTAVHRSDVRFARNLLKSLAKKFQGHLKELKLLNEKFQERWTNTENAVEGVLKGVSRRGQLENPETRRFLASIKRMEENASLGKESLLDLIRIMSEIDPMESSFDKARTGIIEQLNSLAANIDQVISLAIRVRGITGIDYDCTVAPGVE